MNDKQLDERQLALRNKFGFQSFLLLMVLILIEAFLREEGIIFADPFNSALLTILIAAIYNSIRGLIADVYARNYKSTIKITYPLLIFDLFVLITNSVRDGNFHLIYNGKITSIAIFLFAFIFLSIHTIIYTIKYKKE